MESGRGERFEIKAIDGYNLAEQGYTTLTFDYGAIGHSAPASLRAVTS